MQDSEEEDEPVLHGIMSSVAPCMLQAQCPSPHSCGVGSLSFFWALRMYQRVFFGKGPLLSVIKQRTALTDACVLSGCTEGLMAVWCFAEGTATESGARYRAPAAHTQDPGMLVTPITGVPHAQNLRLSGIAGLQALLA